MAKEYLKCRMENNLMAPDEMRNLGFAEDKKSESIPNLKSATAAQHVGNDRKQIS